MYSVPCRVKYGFVRDDNELGIMSTWTILRPVVFIFVC